MQILGDFLRLPYEKNKSRFLQAYKEMKRNCIEKTRENYLVKMFQQWRVQEVKSKNFAEKMFPLFDSKNQISFFGQLFQTPQNFEAMSINSDIFLSRRRKGLKIKETLKAGHHLEKYPKNLYNCT